MGDRNNLLDEYLAARQPKPKLFSFPQFYSRVVKTSPSLPREHGKYFSTTPHNKDVETTVLDREMGKRSNKSQKVKTEQAA
jgi:hypothetical protein